MNAHRIAIVLACALGLACLAARSGAQSKHALLEVPGGQQLLVSLAGKGVQIYACQVGAHGAAWSLTGPEAQLSDAKGKPAGKHYAGPTWEALDGSRVIGTKLTAARPDPSAIEWLLLQAASHDGHGRFDAVSFIRRIETHGGLAPAHGCDVEHIGQSVRVPYRATYEFYVPKSAAK